MALSVAAAAGWAASPWVADSVSASMAVLSIAMFGLMASLPVFWNLPTAAYQGASAAVAIAVITSVGNAPGLVSPYIVGWIKTLTSRLDVAMYMFAAASLLAVALLACLSERPAPDAEYHAPPGDAACPPSISCPNCAACSAAMPSCRARRSSNTAMPTGAACRRRRRWRCCGRAIPAGIGICNRHGQPVVTQGGLTGLAGGACTTAGDIALSLARMDAIEEIDPLSATMTVQAGAPLETVQQAAARAGLLFPLDLGARGSCTLGGNLATNAGGNRVIRYGMARDQVLGLEAVLADGSVLDGTRKMVKDNTGYDLRHLMIGSEGTLGVITRAVLRLRPRPQAVATAYCGLSGYDAVTRLLAERARRCPAGTRSMCCWNPKAPIAPATRPHSSSSWAPCWTPA